MSGVAGGSRIKKADVQKTFDKYVSQVLSKIPEFNKATLSGSVNVGSRPDYGDLDLIVWITAEDKKVAKQKLIDLVTGLPDSIIVPFKSEKHSGRKYYNAGELISVLYPIEGKQGEYIQVDNIIALSEEEHAFKNSFLDLSAEKQGLLIGLAKVILLEKNPVEIFKKLGINASLTLQPNQEYEFNLSSVKLSLRKVELDDNYREISREEVWNTTNWNVIKQLFQGYNIDGTFENLLEDLVRSLKNPRSKQRVKGIFKSMVSVKSGEVGTLKAATKEKALKAVDTQLSESTSGKVVALYAGGFKPPHKGHFENAKKLLEFADKLIIFIGPLQRKGLPITAEQSRAVWEVYAKHLNKPIELRISQVTPIRDLYEWAEKNAKTVKKIVTGSIEAEFSRFKAFIQNREKYPNVDLIEFTTTATQEDSKLSTSNIRDSEEYLQSGEWLPAEVSPEDIKQIVQILLPVLEVRESLKISTFLQEFYSATESLKTVFRESKSTEIQETIEEPQPEPKHHTLTIDQLYSRVVDMLGSKFYDIQKVADRVEIRLDTAGKSEDIVSNSIVDILEYGSRSKQIKLGNIPEISIVDNYLEISDLFRKTATYSPGDSKITLHTAGRHIKDVLRSFCHELIHHIQNEEGRLSRVATTDTTADSNLEELEKEAYLRGNMLFRNWEDSVKNQKSR
jgi:phosphopantetheine adenylyltransferase